MPVHYFLLLNKVTQMLKNTLADIVTERKYRLSRSAPKLLGSNLDQDAEKPC